MASAIWSKSQVPVAMAVTTPMVDHAERLYLQFEFFNWMYKFKVWCPKNPGFPTQIIGGRSSEEEWRGNNTVLCIV